LLLAVDVGNTHIVLGLYAGAQLRHDWRLPTRRDATADETAMLLHALLARHGIPDSDLTEAVISSVVPPLTPVWHEVCTRYLEVAPLVVDADTDTGLRLDVDQPREVGADRIVNAVAAVARFGAPVIVVDLGTATTVDAVVPGGDGGPVYVGGAIAPGVGIAAEALFRQAARLFRVELAPPPAAIGRNTVHGMQSGIIFGSAGQVDALVERVRAELPGVPAAAAVPVVATGGLAPLIASHSRTIAAVEPLLTLEGLRCIAARAAAAPPRHNLPRGSGSGGPNTRRYRVCTLRIDRRASSGGEQDGADAGPQRRPGPGQPRAPADPA
jgi:type III pantothenate kinase